MSDKKSFIIKKIKRFFKALINAPAHSALLRNAYAGFPNSQCELAEFYFFEQENFIEAYAWAEVARYYGHPNAYLKIESEKKLSAEQIKIAIDKAREYKIHFIPNLNAQR